MIKNEALLIECLVYTCTMVSRWGKTFKYSNRIVDQVDQEQ